MGDVTLLPCPFCGGEAEMEDTDFCSWCAQCTNDYCKVGPPETGFHATAELCIAAWNTRALTPAQQAAEEMAKALERIASDFEMDFVLDGHVVDGPSTSHIEAWKAARNALAKAGKP